VIERDSEVVPQPTMPGRRRAENITKLAGSGPQHPKQHRSIVVGALEVCSVRGRRCRGCSAPSWGGARPRVLLRRRRAGVHRSRTCSRVLFGQIGGLRWVPSRGLSSSWC
jgi:hypothetical protein